MVRISESKSHTNLLTEITRQEIGLYAGINETDMIYPLFDDENQRYAVMFVPMNPDLRPAWAIVLARIEGEYIVIDEDGPADKPLHEALMVNGNIPRQQIILAYKGETIPKDISEKS